MSYTKAFRSSNDILVLVLAHTSDLTMDQGVEHRNLRESINYMLEQGYIKPAAAGTKYNTTQKGNFMMTHLFKINAPSVTYEIPNEQR